MSEVKGAGVGKNTKRGVLGGRTSKSDKTRRRILESAKTLFTNFPYNAASIRMIGKEGGFDYTIIHHYFPAKSDIFEAVVTDFFEDYTAAYVTFLDGLDGLPMKQGFSIFIDRLVDYSFEKPGAMSLIMLNIGSANSGNSNNPGLDYIAGTIRNTIHFFSKNSIFLPHESKDAFMWFYSFTLLVANYIGAGAFHAHSLGMVSGSEQHRSWIKRAMMYMFYPSMKSLALTGGVIDKKPLPDVRSISNTVEDGRGVGGVLSKGDMTRLKIVKAARKVFSRRPYNTASIRMIGKEGGFDFTLIHHYYPSKKSLLDAVVTMISREYLRSEEDMLKGLQQLSLHDGFAIFLGRVLRYTLNEFDAQAMIMQNIAQVDKLETIEGYEYFSQFYRKTRGLFANALPVEANDDDVVLWHYGFLMLVVSYTGASGFSLQVMDSAGETDTFMREIWNSLLFISYASLKVLVFSDGLHKSGPLKQPT